MRALTSDLQAQDEEIDDVVFFGPEEVFERMPFPESRAFFAAHYEHVS